MKTINILIALAAMLTMFTAVESAQAGQRCYSDQTTNVLCAIKDGRHTTYETVSAYIDCDGRNGDRCYDLYKRNHSQGNRMNVAYKCKNGQWKSVGVQGERWCEFYYEGRGRDRGRRDNDDWDWED